MKITAQEEYGLRCLLQLAGSSASVTIAEIAAAEGLSRSYVGKLMALLRDGGLIESVPGRTGGYRLATEAEQISLARVLGALGEPMFGGEAFCGRHAGTETGGTCVHLGSCSLRSIWGVLEQWTQQVLSRISLADLSANEGQVADLMKARLLEVANQTGTADQTINVLYQLS